MSGVVVPPEGEKLIAAVGQLLVTKSVKKRIQSIAGRLSLTQSATLRMALFEGLPILEQRIAAIDRNTLRPTS